MLKTLKNKIILLLASLTIAVPTLIPLQASATSCTSTAKSITAGVSATVVGQNNANGNGCGTTGSITAGATGLAKKVVDIFSVIVGIISVIMIIYAGFRYITSGGESGSVSSAKNTLIYAIIGLVVVVLAQIIVHYVINTASTAAGPTGL